MNKETTKQLLYKREEKRLKRFLKTKINTRKTIVKDSPLMVKNNRKLNLNQIQRKLISGCDVKISDGRINKLGGKEK